MKYFGGFGLPSDIDVSPLLGMTFCRQPDISKYASELMPVLFNYLASITNTLQSGGKDPPGK